MGGGNKNVAIRLGRYARTYVPCERDAAADLRRAIYAIGAPGSGKSTLLAHLANEFAGAGEGVLLIDTKGELAEDVAARTIHPDRLVYVAPGECRFPTGPRHWTLNPLEIDRSGEEPLEDIAVANLLALFERMGLARLETMTQVRQLLEMSCYLAFGLPQPSLQDLLRLLHGPALRARLLENPALSSTVARFWRAHEGLTARQQADRIASTVVRINELLTSSVLDRMLSQPRSTIRLAEWLDAGKLVVCNLGNNLAAKTSRILGNLVVAHLINATYARPKGRGRVWRVIVDEFHELAGDQFAELITQGRKFRVFPVIAHQNLAQLGDELTNAVTQCPWRFFLRVSAEDRPVIRRLFGDETAEGLAHQENYTARVHFAEGPTGFFHQEQLRLCDWWAERDEAQLAAARAAAADPRYTLPDGAAPTPSVARHEAGAPDSPAPPDPVETSGALPQLGEVSDEPARPLRDAFPAAPAALAADQPRPRPARKRLAAQAPAAGGGGAPRPRPARLLDQWPGE